jgi:hypothetical protein
VVWGGAGRCGLAAGETAARAAQCAAWGGVAGHWEGVCVRAQLRSGRGEEFT